MKIVLVLLCAVLGGIVAYLVTGWVFHPIATDDPGAEMFTRLMSVIGACLAGAIAVEQL